MGDGGYIKLYRKFLEHPFWTEKRVYSKAEAWIYLLYKARFAESKLMIDNKITVVHRGEFVTSELKLSDKWNWSRGKVRRYLDELETEQMITRKRTTNSTTITIVNYEVYQGDDTTDDTTNEQPTVQRTNIRRTTDGTQNKNIKKDKECKEGKEYRFTPPTIEEVTAYCKERNNNVDPQKWINHYTANGWKVGRNPMKDWKAAVRTWESNSKGGINRGQASGNTGTNQKKPNKYESLDFSKLE